MIVLVSGLAPDDSDEMLVFSTSGKVNLRRGKDVYENPRGMKMLPKDILQINQGSVTLINRSHKRVTLDKAGKYNHTQVYSLMAKAAASPGTRYFVYVWENMQTTDSRVNVPGGIVRGEELSLLPSDSVTILSDTIEFYNHNPMNVLHQITVFDIDFSELFSEEIEDSTIFMSLNAVAATQPGKYRWEIATCFQKPVKRCFFIPETSVKHNLLNEFRKILSEFDQTDDEMLRRALVMEYLEKNKLYIYPY